MDEETEQSKNHPDVDEVTNRTNSEDEVTNRTNNDGEVTPTTRSTKTMKIRVTDIDWLQEEAVDGESPAATLSRLREELTGLRTENVKLVDCTKVMIDDFKNVNEQLNDLRDELEDHSSGSLTAITAPAGQSSISDFGSGAVRETMDAIKDVCDDETVCVKTAMHLLDTKAAVVGKQLDRDHSADQKQLDREDKDKDRKLKIELADKRAQHEKDMAMIKKGIVKDEDLEGVTFLGSMKKDKTAGERLADRRKMAYHAANGEADDFEDPGVEDDL